MWASTRCKIWQRYFCLQMELGCDIIKTGGYFPNLTADMSDKCILLLLLIIPRWRTWPRRFSDPATPTSEMKGPECAGYGQLVYKVHTMYLAASFQPYCSILLHISCIMISICWLVCMTCDWARVYMAVGVSSPASRGCLYQYTSLQLFVAGCRDPKLQSPTALSSPDFQFDVFMWETTGSGTAETRPIWDYATPASYPKLYSHMTISVYVTMTNVQNIIHK